MKKILSFIASFCLLFAQFQSVSAQEIPTGKYLGSYYNGKNFDTLIFTREEPVINFNWWMSSPGKGVFGDNFSARWQGRFDFTAGDWQFASMPDDGLRVYIDGEKMIDAWKTQHGIYYKFVKSMSAGSHLIVVEYFEDKDWAGITFGWNKISSATSGGTATAKTTPGVVAPTSSPLYKALYVSSCEDLIIKPETGDSPLEVTFSGAGYDPYGSIQSFSFNFGDKTDVLTQADSYTTHIYQKPGNYNAVLSVKDSKGNVRTADICKKKISVTGTYEAGVGGYAEPTVIPSTISALPKTGIFDSSLWLILITVPLAGFGLLLNRKFSKL